MIQGNQTTSFNVDELRDASERFVDATIKAIIDRTDGKRLQVEQFCRCGHGKTILYVTASEPIHSESTASLIFDSHSRPIHVCAHQASKS